MLRRQSVKSKSHLERRKSTLSVHGVHLEHLDATAAQRDAQMAACRAYVRALNRAAADMPLFPLTPDSSPRRRQPEGSIPGQDGGKETLGLQQSVRFVGLCSVRGGPSESRREHTADATLDQSFLGDYDTSGSDSIGRVSHDPQPATGPPPRIFRHPRGEPPRVPLSSVAVSYIEALAAGEEYYTPEDDISSRPSSYRRLRRPGSLYKSNDHWPRPSHDGSTSLVNGKLPEPQVPPALNARRLLHSEPKDSAHAESMSPLRAPRSMTFLKNQHFSSSVTRASRDSNRDFSETGNSGLAAPRPLVTAQSTPHLNSNTTATLHAPWYRHAGPGMPKSLRGESSADGLDMPHVVSTMDLEKEDSFKFKAKKASRSLKTKLKSFFSLSRSEEQSSFIPIQHIDSRRTHTSGDFGALPINGMCSATDLQGSIHRVPSGFPTLQVPAKSIHSIKGSLGSMCSEREREVSNDGSMTSWTHSGPSTLTSQQQQQWKNEWERQRLSVIKEHGAHAPSPSLRRQGFSPQPLQHPASSLGDQASQGFVTNSQRIYSALMKRVQGISEQTNQTIEQEERSASANQPQLQYPPEVAQTGYHAVTPNRPTKANGSASNHGAWAEQRRPSLLTPRDRNVGYYQQSLVEFRDPFKANEAENPSIVFASPTNSGMSSPDPFICRRERPTLPIQDLNKHSNQRSAPPSDASTHLFRTGSPFRQALRKSMGGEQMTKKPGGSDSDPQDSECGTEVHIVNPGARINTDAEGGNSGDYAESIYSTDEAMASPGPSRPNGAKLGRGLSEFPGPRPGSHRANSSGVSIDWKAWLSANVAKMESSSPPRPEEIEYVMPTMPRHYPGGHIREAAQIQENYEDDSNIMVAELPTRQPTLPISPLATVEPNVVKLSPQQRSVKHTTPQANRPSLYENNSPMYRPPMPPKSMLRMESSPSPPKRPMPKMGPSIPGSISSSPGLSAAVQRQFGHVPKGGGRVIHYRADETSEESNGNVYSNFNHQQDDSSSEETRVFI